MKYFAYAVVALFLAASAVSATKVNDPAADLDALAQEHARMDLSGATITDFPYELAEGQMIVVSVENDVTSVEVVDIGDEERLAGAPNCHILGLSYGGWANRNRPHNIAELGQCSYQYHTTPINAMQYYRPGLTPYGVVDALDYYTWSYWYVICTGPGGHSSGMTYGVCREYRFGLPLSQYRLWDGLVFEAAIAPAGAIWA